MLYRVHAKTICVGITPRNLQAEEFNQIPIYEGMLSGDLGGRATGDLVSNASCFQERDRKPGFTKQIGGSYASIPAPTITTSALCAPASLGYAVFGAVAVQQQSGLPGSSEARTEPGPSAASSVLGPRWGHPEKPS